MIKIRNLFLSVHNFYHSKRAASFSQQTKPLICVVKRHAMRWVPISPWCYLSVTRVYSMMTSSNGNIFRVTGPLCGEHKGQWRGALMFSLICVRINDWVNNREAGDLRGFRGHYDVIVMETNHTRNNVQCVLQTKSSREHTPVPKTPSRHVFKDVQTLTQKTSLRPKIRRP